MGTNTERLPDGWIRRESTSRPDHFYYFNKKTGKTQWERPANKEKKTHKFDDTLKASSRNDVQVNGRYSVQNRLKISEKSKDVKKFKTKTPAQDRLQNLMAANKAVAEKVKETLTVIKKSTSSNQNKRKKTSVAETITKKPCTVSKLSMYEVNTDKSVQSFKNKDSIETVFEQKPSKRKIYKIEKKSTDEIPTLFPLKNPAQNRLKSLQKKLSSKSYVHDEKEHDAVRVFHSSFGIDNTNDSDTVQDMDEEMMDCDDDMMECDDDPMYSFQQLESMAIDALSDSAYIIPDTNVFLDSLDSLKLIINKDMKYRILIPFVVLQELDRLKRRRDGSVSVHSSRAIKFIYEQLKAKNERIQGQKATQDNDHLINVASPDDKILNCCLQLKHQSNEVLLITNDINLGNKAMLNGIESIKSKDCLERFELKKKAFTNSLKKD